MILQLGAFFGRLVSGVGSGLGQVLKAVAPTALGIGQQFLQREINRKTLRRRTQQIGAQAIQALNTPGIAVARVGGTIQPVGGRVQRSTFQPAALTTAQNPIGNIPLLPVGGRFGRSPVAPFPGPFAGFGTMFVPGPGGASVANDNGLLFRKRTDVAVGQAPGEPRFAQDEFGRTIMFVPSPRGDGFISVQQARQLGLGAMKPWWRFNRIERQFEKIKRRRMNPFNFRAAKRAGRRIENTLEAIKGVVTIQRKLEKGISAGGKVVKFRTGKRKKARA